MTRVFCDRCGKEYIREKPLCTHDGKFYEVSTIFIVEKNGEDEQDDIVDLCDECRSSFSAVIEEFMKMK